MHNGGPYLLSRIRIILLITSVLSILSVAAVVAVPGPGITPEDAKNIMPVSQVKAGMKGHGLTVFQGTKIEKFDVEVVGVLKKVNLGRDLILVRMSGGPMTARGANLIQGMSGSPVYVDGKLIGAVAYGEVFAKEPLGMLTPIEDMLEALDPALPERPSGYSSDPVPLSEPVWVGARGIDNVLFTHGSETEQELPNTIQMTPLGMPLMVSGMSARGVERLREMFGPYNLVPMAGPGSSGKIESVDLVPGAAVGVAMTTGDIELTGIGTLTYRRGNQIVAFGHPMMGIGAIDAPMTTAYVHDISPSVLISSRIASAMEIKGRIFQDRPWSVGGEVGKMASMIPVNMKIADESHNRSRTVNVNVINHPLLAARLITIVAGEAVYELHPTPGDATARVRVEIEAHGIGKIERENVFFDPVAVDSAAIEDLRRILFLLSNNRFSPVDIKSVKVEVTITANRNTATLERAYVEKDKFEPGETIDVGLLLRPYRQDFVTRSLQVTIPDYAPNGRYILQIRGGGRPERAPMMGASPGESDQEGARITVPGAATTPADNVKQLIDRYLEREKNDEIVARLVFPTSAVVVAGERLSRLPGPLASILRSNRATSFRTEREEVKAVEPTDFIIGGAQSLQITVERPGRVDTARPTPPSAPTAPTPAVERRPTPESDSSDGSGDELMDVGALPISSLISEHIWSRLRNPKTEAKPVSVDEDSTVDDEPDSSASTAVRPESKKAEKPVARQPNVWRQDSFEDFSKGTFDGASATTDDEVRLSQRLSRIAHMGETIVWSLEPDADGGLLVGTGTNGNIFRLSDDGTTSMLFDSDELAIHSLLMDSSGNVYAGTSPNGLVYRISADGSAEVVFNADEMHIVALAQGPHGDIYAAAGDGGKIYRIYSGGGVEFVSLGEPEIASLTIDSAGNLYAGTGPYGVVYKIRPTGQIAPVYDAAELYASALAIDNAGNLFVGTAPKGMVYKIPKNGAPKTVLDKSQGAITGLVAADAGIYAATDGQIFLIEADDRVQSVDAGNSRAQFTTVAVDAQGSVFAGAANPAAVYANSGAIAAGTFESPVHDAKLPSRWGTISWDADVPDGTSTTLQTRTGNSGVPGESWSEWSGQYVNFEGEPIVSPRGRFIQYRANLAGTVDAAPVLQSVSVVYLPANQPPKVNISAPAGRVRWSGTQTVRWSGSDPDKDTLLYDVYYSSDGGATWNALRRGVKATPESEDAVEEEPETEDDEDVETETEAPSSREEIVVAQLKAEIESNQSIPQEMKDRILAEAPQIAELVAKDGSEVEAQEEKTRKPAEDAKSEPSKETSYSWDTTEVPDGRYMVKVLASDRLSNADDFLTDEKISDPFIIVNRPPRVVVFEKDLVVQPDKSVVVPGYSYQTLAEIAGVEYRVDEGDWAAAAPDDGIFDSTTEAFTVRTLPLNTGERTIEVKAIDSAGNAATTKLNVKVE